MYYYYYPSNIYGTKIRNAITGKQYNSFVSSKDENNFFKVIGYFHLYCLQMKIISLKILILLVDIIEMVG